MQWAEIFSEVLIKENLHYHIKIILKQNWKESRIISQSFPNKIFFFSGISPVGLYWHCSAIKEDKNKTTQFSSYRIIKI